MARIDKAPEGGKFRATAAAGLDATAGAWGAGEFLNVLIDSNGEIDEATATDIVGFIVTSEGQDADATANKLAIGGRVYTVFFQCEIVEASTFAAPTVSAGDSIWATAAGDITITPATGDVFLGHVLLGDERVVINMHSRPVSV
jgi:hypothetical protein